MADALAEEGKAAGKPFPSIILIRQVAARDEWNGQRRGLEAAARAQAQAMITSKEANRVFEAYEKYAKAGGYTFAMGGNWIAETERTYQEALKIAGGDTAKVNVPKVINTIYEALAAMRVGATLERLAVEGILNKKVGPTVAQLTNMPDATGKEIANASELIQDEGIVFLPATLDEDAWNRQRRKNLGASAVPPETK